MFHFYDVAGCVGMEHWCEMGQNSSGKIRGGIYLFKVNNRNTWATCEICPKLTIKTLEGC